MAQHMYHIVTEEAAEEFIVFSNDPMGHTELVTLIAGNTSYDPDEMHVIDGVPSPFAPVADKLIFVNLAQTERI